MWHYWLIFFRLLSRHVWRWPSVWQLSDLIVSRELHGRSCNRQSPSPAVQNNDWLAMIVVCRYRGLWRCTVLHHQPHPLVAAADAWHKPCTQSPHLVTGSSRVEDTWDHTSTPVFFVGTTLLCFLPEHGIFPLNFVLCCQSFSVFPILRFVVFAFQCVTCFGSLPSCARLVQTI